MLRFRIPRKASIEYYKLKIEKCKLSNTDALSRIPQIMRSPAPFSHIPPLTNSANAPAMHSL